jgi:hypothetical protein
MNTKDFKTGFRMVVMLLLLLPSCADFHSITIITGENPGTTELITINQFKNDLELVTGEKIQIINDDNAIPTKGTIFLVGTAGSNPAIARLTEKKAIVLNHTFPGKRGGIRAKTHLPDGQDVIILAGSDVLGMQYAVYDYCSEILKIDPFAYWTGKIPPKKLPSELLSFNNKVIAPPVVPILCYFENDVDELANLREPLLEYDWESYTEMINSLVRLKYNAIHLFDMLGRPEFFLRPEYQQIRPGYDIRLTYIDSLINYAHDMGMMVQIDLSLGYKIKPMAQEKADCWEKNKADWIATWKYYFEETPLRKADIFSLRPRNQVWDWEYASSCGEDKTQVFNEVYAELGKIIDHYKPGAVKVVTCYADGMEMFNGDFNPPKDWIIAWSDDGWGGFNNLPESTKDYRFGTYMHAGFWKNHTVHDPYPGKLDSVMKMISNQFQATHYYEINGQQFRPFLLNIEAFSRIADNPHGFNGETFYRDWTERYFGKDAAVYAVQSMKKLHEAHFGNVGYVEHLWEIKEALAYLGETEIQRPGKTPIPFDYNKVESNFVHVKQRIEILKTALQEAEKGLQFISDSDTFYHDYIILPVQLYLDLIVFEDLLHESAKQKKAFDESGKKENLQEAILQFNAAMKALEPVLQRSLDGDKNPRWKGWYDPVKRRPNNGFPTNEMLEEIKHKLEAAL